MNPCDQRWSWVVALACCFINCLLYGVTRLSGLILVAIVETFHVSRARAAVPFSVCTSVRNLSGIFVGYFGQKFGLRPVVGVGCLLASLGAGLCFFASDIFWITICWGIIFGMGCGLGTCLLPFAINQHFDKHRGKASGISYSGSYIGSFIFPPVVVMLLERYGLNGAFLVISSTLLNGLAASLLFKPKSSSKLQKRNLKELKSKMTSTELESCTRNVWQKLLHHVKWTDAFLKTKDLATVTPEFSPIYLIAVEPLKDSDEKLQHGYPWTLEAEYAAKRLDIARNEDFFGMVSNSKINNRIFFPRHYAMEDSDENLQHDYNSSSVSDFVAKRLNLEKNEDSLSKKANSACSNRNILPRRYAQNLRFQSSRNALFKGKLKNEYKLSIAKLRQTLLIKIFKRRYSFNSNLQKLPTDDVKLLSFRNFNCIICPYLVDKIITSKTHLHPFNNNDIYFKKNLIQEVYKKNLEDVDILNKTCINNYSYNIVEPLSKPQCKYSSANIPVSKSKNSRASGTNTNSRGHSVGEEVYKNWHDAMDVLKKTCNENYSNSIIKPLSGLKHKYASPEIPFSKSKNIEVSEINSCCSVNGNCCHSNIELSLVLPHKYNSPNIPIPKSKNSEETEINSFCADTCYCFHSIVESSTEPQRQNASPDISISKLKNSETNAGNIGYCNCSHSSVESSTKRHVSTNMSVLKPKTPDASEINLRSIGNCNYSPNTIDSSLELQQQYASTETPIPKSKTPGSRNCSWKIYRQNQKRVSLVPAGASSLSKLSASNLTSNSNPQESEDIIHQSFIRNHSWHDRFGRCCFGWFRLHAHPMFVVIATTMSLHTLVTVCMITIIEDFAKDLNVPDNKVHYALMALSTADLLGALTMGFITDHGLISRCYFIVLCFLGTGVFSIAISFSHNLGMLLTLVAFYGIFETGVIITFPLLIAQFIEVKKQAVALASSNALSSPTVLLVPIIIGYFRDRVGCYSGVFYVLGALSFCSSLVWLVASYLFDKHKRLNQKDSNVVCC